MCRRNPMMNYLYRPGISRPAPSIDFQGEFEADIGLRKTAEAFVYDRSVEGNELAQKVLMKADEIKNKSNAS
ncbi:hypothetical protein [Aliamphritea ceti]|uniref:hypothetical protein n=1 Tax=Aliamphritea ceti TaxID=1524258 RepID=UPI0021C353AD|nr:hypothetical protein [Aliamphritea ceti]